MTGTLHELLDDYLATLEPQLPVSLVGHESCAALRRQLGLLPAALTSFFGFECRLADEDLPTDLQLVVRAGSRGQAILAGGDREIAMPDAWQDCPQWRQVRQFAQAWQRMPEDHVPLVWLGFDCDPSESTVPLPLLHIRTDRRTADEIHALLRQAVGCELPSLTTRLLTKCFANAIPTFVGVMLGRSTSAIRLTQPLETTEVPRYLDAIGWAGDRERVASLLESIRRWTTHVGLSLNIGATAESYLGLEFLNWTKPASNRRTWKSCLDSLTEWELCTVEKREALLNWPHLIHSRLPQWCGEPRDDDATGEHVLETLACDLSHLKLVCRAGLPLEAKAYIDVRHNQWQWRAPARAA